MHALDNMNYVYHYFVRFVEFQKVVFGCFLVAKFGYVKVGFIMQKRVAFTWVKRSLNQDSHGLSTQFNLG